MTWHRRFFWVLLIFLPTQLGVHFWPDWAHVLGRRVDYLAPTVYLTDILLFSTVFFWLLESLSRIRNQESGIRKRTKRMIFSMIHNSIFLILLTVVNIFTATNQMVALYKWIKVAEFVMLGWYIVRTKPSLSLITYHLSLGVLYSSVLAIVQFLLQHSVGGPLWLLGERTFSIDTPGIARIALGGREILRPYAAFPHPNVLGGFLAAVLPLLIFNFQFSIFNKFSMFKIITMLFGLIALLLTFSRSAIVVGAIAIASVVFRRKTHLFFTAILLLLVVFSLLPFTFSEESFVVRGQLNTAAVKLWQSAPLFGVGLGNFLVRLPEALPTRTIYFLQPVHNIYLLLLSETGIVGIVLLLWFLWSLFKNFKFQISNFKLSLLVLLLLGFLDHYPLTLQQGQLLLTILLAMRYN